MKKTIQDRFLYNIQGTLSGAMSNIDLTARGIIFIVDNDNVLKGCLTDGDVRRWLLRTGELNSPVHEVMNPSPLVYDVSDRSAAVEYLYEHLISAIPLVDKDNRVIDIILRVPYGEENSNYPDLKGTPVIIMAGGKGSRLYPYTKVLPKPLIPIDEEPILDRILKEFSLYNINEFYLTVNYKKEMIKAYYKECNTSYSIKFVEEPKPLGTAGSIGFLKGQFDTPIIVTNCDIMIRADYSDLMKHHKESGNKITIVTSLKDFTLPYGVIKTSDQNDRVSEISEKPHMSYLINTGMYVLDPDCIDYIPTDEMYHMTQLVDEVMKDHRVGIYPISESAFLDMGNYDEMRRMEERISADNV